MRIRFIEIHNFRGIKCLKWAPSPHVNCLIGPGDAGKTAILDAIEFALTPRAQITFDDSHFFNLDYNNSISIFVTLGELPEAFKALAVYGSHLRAWDCAAQSIIEEPNEAAGLESVLTISLVVDRTLEPRWRIFRNRSLDDGAPERTIRFDDRPLIAPTRLGVYADRHLTWGRNSILTRLTGKGRVGMDVLAEASRAARRHFTASGEILFKEVIDKIPTQAGKAGVKIGGNVAARLDVASVALSAAGISLHEGELPLRLLGEGSSRLLVAALQADIADSAAVALIDEVEHGLEPHRISRLLRYLRSHRDGARPQLFLTTHSPVVLQELAIGDLAVVRRHSSTGRVDIFSAEAGLSAPNSQAQLRTTPAAYLARSVLVCEGKTEVGLVRGLDRYWSDGDIDPFAALGVAPADGGGKDKAPLAAQHFAHLHFRVALFLDSDKEPDDATILPAIESQGVKVLRWENGKATEDVLFNDLGDEALWILLKLLAAEPELSVCPDHINTVAQSNVVSDWAAIQARCTDPAIRAHMTACAKKCEWIKPRLSLSEEIGFQVLVPFVVDFMVNP
ncbi:MAG: ATP-dependent nuclease [Acetobacteraceae bacterium]